MSSELFRGEGGADGGEGGGEAPAAEGLQAMGFPEDVTPEDIGFIQNKGWAQPGDVYKSYRALEKLHGGGDDALVRIPSDFDNETDVNEFYAKLGRPETADGYEFSKELTERQDSMIPTAREWFHSAGLSPRQATSVAESFDKWVQDQQQAEQDAYENEGEKQLTALRQEWGGAFDENVRYASAFRREFDISDEMWDQLDRVLGPKALMEKAAMIGKTLGEPGEINDDAGRAALGGTTSAQAQAKIAELQNDTEFMKAYDDKMHPNHDANVERMRILYEKAYPGEAEGPRSVEA